MSDEKLVRNVCFIKEGYQRTFQVSMMNREIANMEKLVKSSWLCSLVRREIYEVPVDQVGYTRYCMLHTEYQPPSTDRIIPWRFAQNTEFYGCLYCLNDENMRRRYYERAKERPPFPGFSECFGKFPRLPSVYLLIMQAIDIITLDAFMCMVNSSFRSVNPSFVYQEIPELMQRKVDIGAGIYDSSSYYFNTSLFVRQLGSAYFDGRNCWVLDFDSDPADVYMKHIKTKKVKNSKSLYNGQIYISAETGDIIRAELSESIISRNKFVNRKVVMEEAKE